MHQTHPDDLRQQEAPVQIQAKDPQLPCASCLKWYENVYLCIRCNPLLQ